MPGRATLGEPCRTGSTELLASRVREAAAEPGLPVTEIGEAAETAATVGRTFGPSLREWLERPGCESIVRIGLAEAEARRPGALKAHPGDR
jgi:hypothetical protein